MSGYRLPRNQSGTDKAAKNSYYSAAQAAEIPEVSDQFMRKCINEGLKEAAGFGNIKIRKEELNGRSFLIHGKKRRKNNPDNGNK